jgi:hypothetical protein
MTALPHFASLGVHFRVKKISRIGGAKLVSRFLGDVKMTDQVLHCQGLGRPNAG